ncbi:hypothetical protein PR048_005948 [Dryococelus australis]|uniref:HAT C-terminal dimerisation domain-containing protein n=1 Tax=Dryococelus australis TaxID=614101 RepID=A0ABQ9I9L1_9NEOP|nr:hypothetical protein PR048_005948 [Dryococelus australis]
MAKCSVCPQFKGLCDLSSQVVNGFREPFRYETFKFHNLPVLHKRCMEASDVQGHPEKSSMAKKETIEKGITDIKGRFSKTAIDAVLTSLSILNTFTWPETSLESFGKKEVTVLVSHYKDLLQHDEKEDILQKALDEWYKFKVCAKGLSSTDLLGKTMSNGDRLPVLLKLLKVASVLPVSTANCERGFRQMNLVKNKLRSSLETESLDDHMKVTTTTTIYTL